MATENKTWNNETEATPELLKPLFNDLGLREECLARAIVAREATRKYCLHLIKKDAGLEMADLSVLAVAFYEGYLAGLNDMDYANLPGDPDIQMDQTRKVFSVFEGL